MFTNKEILHKNSDFYLLSNTGGLDSARSTFFLAIINWGWACEKGLPLPHTPTSPPVSLTLRPNASGHLSQYTHCCFSEGRGIFSVPFLKRRTQIITQEGSGFQKNGRMHISLWNFLSVYYANRVWLSSHTSAEVSDPVTLSRTVKFSM